MKMPYLTSNAVTRKKSRKSTYMLPVQAKYLHGGGVKLKKRESEIVIKHCTTPERMLVHNPASYSPKQNLEERLLLGHGCRKLQVPPRGVN
jgi:hypothetical protein